MNIIGYARSYIGTPFHHQGRLPNVGLDCAGVIVCAMKEAGLSVTDKTGYGRIPSNGVFVQAVMDHCDVIDQVDLKAGDLMMFAFRGEPQHIAIVSHINPTWLIHAYESVGRVVENELDATWQSRLRGCYRLRVPE